MTLNISIYNIVSKIKIYPYNLILEKRSELIQYSDKEVGSGWLALGITKNRWQLPNLNVVKEKSLDE